MNVLITGNAGFIGSHVSQRFLDEKCHVTGVDDMSNGHLEFVPAGVESRITDFASESVLDDVRAKKFDAVVHLAAVPRVSYSVEHPLETHEVNVSRTLRLMDACRGNVQRFVFASSSSVYGGADELPTHESTRKNPQSPYALQKSIIEDYMEMYERLYGLDTIALRFFNVFGPRALGNSPYATAVSAWLTAIKQGKPMRSDGDGSQSRDMCYVENVADACYRAVSHAAPSWGGHVNINVACGDRVTNKEVRDYLLKRYLGSTYVDAPWRAGDVMHTQADVMEAKAVLGYTPIVRFWEGLERTCDWYDANWYWAKDLKLRT